jgi:hypothetical protein
MTDQPNEEWWERARRARDQLAAQYLSHPDVTLIDIGLDPQHRSSMPVLRIHVRRIDTSIPATIDDIEDIPVRIIYGNYRLQSGES